MASIAEPFAISHIAGRYLLFDVNVISHTRRDHNVCGVLIGTIPNLSQQNVFLGIPLELMPEEVRVLVEQGHAYILDDVQAHRAGFLEMSREDRLAVLQAMDEKGQELAMSAKKKSGERQAQALKERGLTLQEPGKPEPTEQHSSKSGRHFITPTASYPLLAKRPETSASTLPKVPRSYSLFRHLHSMGYFSTPGLRFGCHYTVYPGDPLRFHSHFLSTGLNWDEEFDLLDIVGGGRLGTGVKKSYLIGGEDPSGSAVGEQPGSVGSCKPVRAFSIEWAGL